MNNGTKTTPRGLFLQPARKRTFIRATHLDMPLDSPDLKPLLVQMLAKWGIERMPA